MISSTNCSMLYAPRDSGEVKEKKKKKKKLKPAGHIPMVAAPLNRSGMHTFAAEIVDAAYMSTKKKTAKWARPGPNEPSRTLMSRGARIRAVCLTTYILQIQHTTIPIQRHKNGSHARTRMRGAPASVPREHTRA